MYEEIISFLERKKQQNDLYCELNSCSPSPYMDGSNRIINETLEFIKNIQKDVR